MGAPLAIVDKRRTDMNVAEVMNVDRRSTWAHLPGNRRYCGYSGTLVKTVDALWPTERLPFMPVPAMQYYRACD